MIKTKVAKMTGIINRLKLAHNPSSALT